jgi:hypothetical protein
MSQNQGRSMREIVRDLCSFNPALTAETARLPHDCYMIFIGRLTNREHLQKLTRAVETNKDSRGNAGTSQGFTMMETEEIELSC